MIPLSVTIPLAIIVFFLLFLWLLVLLVVGSGAAESSLCNVVSLELRVVAPRGGGGRKDDFVLLLRFLLAVGLTFVWWERCGCGAVACSAALLASVTKVVLLLLRSSDIKTLPNRCSEMSSCCCCCCNDDED